MNIDRVTQPDVQPVPERTPADAVAELYRTRLARSKVPAFWHDELTQYLAHRWPVGDFLKAVLENNLRESIRRADQESVASLPELVSFLSWDVPDGCWGSPEKVARHLAGRVKGGAS